MFSTLPRVTLTDQAVLVMLQISDSLFPTGGFTQSYGLETYVQEGLINSKETLRQFLVGYLEELITSDGLAVSLAYRATENHDLAAIIELEHVVAAQKLALESREASVKTGRRMLKAAIPLFQGAVLTQFQSLINEGKVYGHHAVVFGLIARACGLGGKQAGLAFVYNTTAGMVNNAVRLIPLGQQDGQWVLTSLHAKMVQSAEKSQELTLEDLGAFLPGLEIRSMQHEHLYSRLFMS